MCLMFYSRVLKQHGPLTAFAVGSFIKIRGGGFGSWCLQHIHMTTPWPLSWGWVGCTVPAIHLGFARPARPRELGLVHSLSGGPGCGGRSVGRGKGLRLCSAVTRPAPQLLLQAGPHAALTADTARMWPPTVPAAHLLLEFALQLRSLAWSRVPCLVQWVALGTASRSPRLFI